MESEALVGQVNRVEQADEKSIVDREKHRVAGIESLASEGESAVLSSSALLTSLGAPSLLQNNVFFLKHIFFLMDLDHNGYIEEKEFFALKHFANPHLTQEEVTESIAKMDTDNDRRVSLDEFVCYFAKTYRNDDPARLKAHLEKLYRSVIDYYKEQVPEFAPHPKEETGWLHFSREYEAEELLGEWKRTFLPLPGHFEYGSVAHPTINAAMFRDPLDRNHCHFILTLTSDKSFTYSKQIVNVGPYHESETRMYCNVEGPDYEYQHESHYNGPPNFSYKVEASGSWRIEQGLRGNRKFQYVVLTGDSNIQFEDAEHSFTTESPNFHEEFLVQGFLLERNSFWA